MFPSLQPFPPSMPNLAHKIGLSADIEEMFLQVRLPEEDATAFSFLWHPDGNLDSPPDVYGLQVHPFGATSSPFCATNNILCNLEP
ncbi:unnamed protein product [Schistosoma margrebowiei]|uniref:Uncharacterized protein n=1 Tax=Schistosoma margrebowiei TaxID=48269 RepID=A0A183MGT8_9TREM|nr:unnamed protein product [Schistosoma margrebowiei]